MYANEDKMSLRSLVLPFATIRILAVRDGNFKGGLIIAI